jgi:hypothetical protein
MRKNLHPLTFIDACRTFTENKQWIWVQWGGGWLRFNTGDSDVRDRPRSWRPCTAVSCPEFPGTRTTHQFCPLHRDAKLKARIRRVRPERPFFCNTTTPGPIQVWILWSTFKCLTALSYLTHRAVRILRLVTSIFSGRWKLDNLDNIFLTTTPSSELQESGSPPLVKIFASASVRLLFVAGENA